MNLYVWTSLHISEISLTRVYFIVQYRLHKITFLRIFYSFDKADTVVSMPESIQGLCFRTIGSVPSAFLFCPRDQLQDVFH
jgi:hypothetical protein